MTEVYSAMIVFRMGMTKQEVDAVLQALDPALEFAPKRGVVVNPGGSLALEFKANYVLTNSLKDKL